MCNPVLGSMHLPLPLCVDIYTLSHSCEIFKTVKNSRILYVTFGAYAKVNFERTQRARDAIITSSLRQHDVSDVVLR